MSDKSRLPERSEFPAGTEFVIKEFDVPLVRVPGEGWFNWFGGTPHPYDERSLRVDNNWPAGSFEEWLGVVEMSLRDNRPGAAPNNGIHPTRDTTAPM